jgi:hypothetical protein
MRARAGDLFLPAHGVPRKRTVTPVFDTEGIP